jgi:hypothetical protein
MSEALVSDLRATVPPSSRPGGRAARAAAVTLALLLALAGTVHARGVPVIESDHDGDVIHVRASAELAADRDTAWRVLTAYDRYPAFIPDLLESRVITRSESAVTVEQRGHATFGPLRLPIEVTYRILEHPPDAVESRAVAGSLRSLDSRYALTSVDGVTRLSYSGRIDPGFPLFDSLERAIVVSNIARQFRALVDEIDRNAAGEPPPAPSPAK